MSSLFVTGTDTGIGKTHVSCRIVTTLRREGLDAVGMKPVASGCRATPEGLRNEDAEALIAASHWTGAYETINPLAFADPIAPHIAAADAGFAITLAPIGAAYAVLAAARAPVVVEGVGGWLAPLSDTLMQADLVRAFGLDVVLVVGLRLGCLNHALLTARAIVEDGCRLTGWIANRVDADMPRFDENLATLRARLAAPLLGVVAHGADATDTLDLAPLRR